MREILFRGKRTDNGEWVEGNLFYDVDLEQAQIFYFEYSYSEGGLERAECAEIVAPDTVGQYTGLTDKYGKKIFEGDIVNFKTTAYYFKNCRIKYRSCYGRYCAIDNHGYEYPMDETFEYEVIGNIHDNPELMKGAGQ